ncbi:MAG: helix-turn-helix transcriptional regulator [Ruminococcaceae bacterium]|nr:helix-turn-helix transcriptional regulator [Oscillospiraceae bacterium]
MNISIEKQIGKNIRRLRKRCGLTQEIMAARLQIAGCDITRSAVAKIESGQRHLYADELILIKNILNTTYDELLTVAK